MDSKNYIKGLHHVTATVNDAREDYEFYTQILGLRLIKETVNFDNEKVYHFYYANETGTPSTIFTTFPYKDQGVRQGVIGTGQIYETAFSVPAGSLNYWKERLEENGLKIDQETRFGKTWLLFEDPSGLKLSILEDADDNREPVWIAEDIDADKAVIGIYSVTLAVRKNAGTAQFLTLFGYSKTGEEGRNSFYEAGEGGAGNSLILFESDELPQGVNGLGTVHHVAHRVEDLEHSLQIKEELEQNFGLQVTEVRDRKYFKSIYFRIPGDILFEIATESPGFLVDESREKLGQSLKLPDWQEPRREQIEKNLEPYR